MEEEKEGRRALKTEAPCGSSQFRYCRAISERLGSLRIAMQVLLLIEPSRRALSSHIEA